jgi:CBS domain-containing protein
MSPRAACRLEVFGFSTVYDYVLGKTDWMGAGLPTVRADTSLRELPNGRSVVVVSGERTVIGQISSRQSRDEPGVAADGLQPGPTTVRAHEPLFPLLERMAKAHVTEMLVTTPEGRLLGVVHVPDDAR